MTIGQLKDILVKYIEDNKVQRGIYYENSILLLKELMEEIENDYYYL